MVCELPLNAFIIIVLIDIDEHDECDEEVIVIHDELDENDEIEVIYQLWYNMLLICDV